jgi:hypothetical protein
MNAGHLREANKLLAEVDEHDFVNYRHPVTLEVLQVKALAAIAHALLAWEERRG